MKQFFYFLSCALLLTATACNDDDTNVDMNATVTGTWTIQTYDLISTISIAGQTETVVSEIRGKDGSDLQIILNESPNTYTFEGDGEIASTSTDADGNTSTSVEDLDTVDNGTWERDGDLLLFTDSEGETTSARITELTSSVLRSEFEGEVVIDFFGEELTTTFEGDLVWVR